MKREIELKLTAEELAREFFEMGSDYQAQFFTRVGELMAGGGSWPRHMQLRYIADELRGPREIGACDWILELVRNLE